MYYGEVYKNFDELKEAIDKCIRYYKKTHQSVPWLPKFNRIQKIYVNSIAKLQRFLAGVKSNFGEHLKSAGWFCVPGVLHISILW